MPIRLTTLLLLAIMAAAAWSMSGCAAKISDRDLVFLDPADAAEAVRGPRRVIGGSTPGAYVDPRSEREFREGHIPGAIHLPMERVRSDHGRLRDYSVLIVYGNDFNSPRATAVSKMLLELGHREVRTLRGGLRAWKEAGKPVESE